jgi:hypothetical protein
MYYPSYEDYMRDVFYFNGLTNPNATFYPNMNGAQSLENMYPSIYKIVNPVIQKVVSGNNYQFVNEDTVNNIVDVVMGITAGDVNSTNGNNNEIRKGALGNNCSNQNCNTNNSNNNSSQENPLLRDLIKILTIKELILRNNVRRFPYTYGGAAPFYMNNQMMPYMVN